MGDNCGQKRASGGQPNGLRPGDASGVTRILDAERWTVGESRTEKLIARIQPDKPSEERRKAVADYVERLITQTFPCQVFTFGSVPLKTYLPDGDIDLSAFSDNLHLKDTWANELHQVLENEEKNENAEFCVKEVQYIQAEVKIIKCLVENIVVDVSFNQLGGLCTLCFLEAIDHLIDQDHLFKRSIILIKAWCYYESRILGAHHGLISTYALEILVLYIFHVFNNSFSGPLEVLYRFLEFFSNFDWENFCVSLWGPVPISSLPDTTAEPPLKDGGELLLSKLFYSVCNTISPAFSSSQESQSQPFVSKHFNVIDPLRTNNNLGRSVSKGNFYRIRSAFAFGAKRLARVLDCSANVIADEIDNFFINTWRRHGSGSHHPDLPSPVLRQLQSPNSDSTENFGNVKKNVNEETKHVNFGTCGGHGYCNDETMTLGVNSSHPTKTISQPTQNIPNTSNPGYSLACDNYGHQTRGSDQIERKIVFNENMSADKLQKKSNSDIFPRTHLSPELTGPTSKNLSWRKQTMVVEDKKLLTSEKPTQSNEWKKISESAVGHSVVSVDSSLQHSLSQRCLDFQGLDSNIILDGYHNDSQFLAFESEIVSLDTIQAQHKMHQEEQDLINMITSSSFHSVSGWVQHPTNISSHSPVLFPPVLIPNGYSQGVMGGMVPSNNLVCPPGSMTQFPRALASSHYIPNAGLDSNQEMISKSVNDNSSMTEMELEDSDLGSWSDQNTGSEVVFLPEKRSIHFQKTISDDKQVPSLGGFKSISSHSGDSSGVPVTGENKFVRGDRRSTEDDYNDSLVHPNKKENDFTDESVNSRLLPACPAISSDFSSKMSKSGMHRSPRKQVSSIALASSSYNKGKNEWQFEDPSSDHISICSDEDNRECATPASRIAEKAEKGVFSSSLATAHVQGCQVSGSSPPLLNGSDPVIPVSPMLLCTSSQQSEGGDSGAGPIAFFPAGPLVPFVMVPFPLCKAPDSDNSGETQDQIVLNTNHPTPLGKSKDVGHGDPDFSGEPSSSQNEGHNPDILNSDLVGHWQNLQFGRFCHIPSQGSPVGPSPVMVPPMPLQGHFSLDGSRRPPTMDFNAFSKIMNSGHRFIPFMPSQPGFSRPSGVNRNYREEVPRFQGGTGTYLPDPKIPSTDRQSLSARHRRGSFHHDWNEHDDRGNWKNTKSRYGGRSRFRNQVDKSYSRENRSSTFANKADRQRDSHRHGRISSHQTDNTSFGSERSKYGSAGDATTEHVENDVAWPSDGSKTAGLLKQRHDK